MVALTGVALGVQFEKPSLPPPPDGTELSFRLRRHVLQMWYIFCPYCIGYCLDMRKPPPPYGQDLPDLSDLPFSAPDVSPHSTGSSVLWSLISFASFDSAGIKRLDIVLEIARRSSFQS